MSSNGNSAKHLSDYLRLPINAGVGVTRVTDRAPAVAVASPESPEYFQTLIDHLNAALLARLAERLPAAAYLLAFVRGSVVKSRLELAQTFWPRLNELFDFAAITAALAATHASAEVEGLLAHIRHLLIAKLLHDRRKLGAAKLIFRLDDPRQEYCSPATYADCADFVAQVAQLGARCDDHVSAVLRDSDLGEAQPFVRRQLPRLLQRFDLGTLSEAVESQFKSFVQRLRQANCLHPALPITAAAVQQVQEVFGIAAETAHQLIVLFRLAWICSSPDKPKYYSDLALKSVVVVPQPETGRSQAQEHAEATLQQVVETLTLTCQNNGALQRFRQRYSKAGITNMAFVMSLPQPLFDLFVALPQEQDRFTFITCYRMGPDDFNAFAARATANLQNRHLAAALHEAGYERLRQRLIYLRVGANDEGFYKHETLQPLAESREQLLQWLAGALHAPESELLQQCATYFDELAKYDLAGNIRGLAMIKAASSKT